MTGAPTIPPRQRLLDAAVDVMLERGIAGLSLSELARAVGSNNRMLLYYFGSKDELFTAAAQAAYGRFPDLVGLIPSLRGPAPIEELLCDGWRLLRAERNRPYLRLFVQVLAEVVAAPEENEHQLGALVTVWPEGMRAAFVAHGWAPDAAARATLQMLALWRGLQIQLLLGSDVVALDAAHDDAVAAILRAR